jgi:hypothetical protein
MFDIMHLVCICKEMINPFRLSRLEKFLQPGREGILNPLRATKRAGLLEKLAQQGHKAIFF